MASAPTGRADPKARGRKTFSARAQTFAGVQFASLESRDFNRIEPIPCGSFYSTCARRTDRRRHERACRRRQFRLAAGDDRRRRSLGSGERFLRGGKARCSTKPTSGALKAARRRWTRRGVPERRDVPLAPYRIKINAKIKERTYGQRRTTRGSRQTTREPR